MVYCDTSFLVSYLNEDDVNHAAARALAGKFSTDDFVVCEVHQLELPAAVRAATHREKDGIPDQVARRVINRFDRLVTGKIFSANRWTWWTRWRCRGRWVKVTDGTNVTRLLTCGTWRRHGRCPLARSLPSINGKEKSPG